MYSSLSLNEVFLRKKRRNGKTVKSYTMRALLRVLVSTTILICVRSEEEVRLVSSAKSFRDGITDNVPMVWRGGAFRFVPSASDWSDDREILRKLKERIQRVDIRMRDRYFTYFDENMLLSKFISRDGSYERVDVSRDFFCNQMIKRDASPPFVRFGGPLGNISMNLFEKDEPYNVENIFDSKPSLSLFWGGPGVVSTSHFDYHRNVYILLWGEKEFLFAHPDNWSLFKPFPMIHPHARQGQLHFESETMSSMSRRRVQLKRGDVLYVPPGWIHHVRSGESGMHLALSACILTDTHRRMNEWFTQNRESVAPIPFLKNDWKWNFDNVLGVLKIFFRDLQKSSLNTSYEELLYKTFSPRVRKSLGFPNANSPGRSAAFPCPGDVSSDLESATREASKRVVELYKNIPTSWEQREFLKPLLEGILFRLGGKMLLGLDFIEACVLEKSASHSLEL